MIFTITNSGLQNGRPTAIGTNTISINNRATHVFTIANFTSETNPVYSDPENDPLAYIQVLSLPVLGSLKLSGIPVSVGDNISSGNLSLGNLTYDAPNQDEASLESFRFDVADAGSNSLSGLVNDGIININAEAYENQPPSSVGSNAIAIAYADEYEFTEADFTTNTTPAYADPEGDAADQLKILSLPDTGELRLNGLALSVNSIVLFTEIASGYFTYAADSGQTSAYATTFNFSIADAGSGEFTE